MSFDIEKFLIIDNHAHSLLKNYREMDEIGFRQCFSESRSLAVLKEHMPHSAHYMYLLDHLERIFNIRSEQEFLAFRMKQPASHFVQMLWDDVSIGAMIIDDGYSRGDTMDLPELHRVCGRPIFHCRRVEPLMEECLAVSNSFAELKENYRKKLFPKNSKSIALKTICGYRGGLELLQASETEAKLDFDRQKKEAGKRKTYRISKCPLYHYLLLQSFEMAGEAGLPVQIHTGIGDDDADLIQCNPALMQALFRSRSYARTRFVLLHCYPYVKEAAFLCSIYSNVYMDLSLSISLASAQSGNLVAETLALAPASKVLAGTDGHSCPESHWYGALNWKRGLTFTLHGMINAGLITQRQAEEVAALILHDNAIRLYKLEGLA